MTDRTHFLPRFAEWHDIAQPTVGPEDTLRASIHPGGQTVTFSYWASEDDLVLDVGHLDAMVSLLLQTKATLEHLSGRTDTKVGSAYTAPSAPSRYPAVPQIEVVSKVCIRPSILEAEEAGY